ncbi:hypothetical protein QUB60_03985 [Microcoleus sp. A2-C5]|uniref:hypothetical protein n=1 Tax=unclassified Microcoleus TaxID=2642155 RepID=UPI002FD3CEAC
MFLRTQGDIYFFDKEVWLEGRSHKSPIKYVGVKKSAFRDRAGVRTNKQPAPATIAALGAHLSACTRYHSNPLAFC